MINTKALARLKAELSHEVSACMEYSVIEISSALRKVQAWADKENQLERDTIASVKNIPNCTACLIKHNPDMDIEL